MAVDALTSIDALKRRLFANGPTSWTTAQEAGNSTDPTSWTYAQDAAAPVTGGSQLSNPAPDPYASSLSGDMNTDYDPTYENLMSSITGQQNNVNSQYGQAVQQLRTAFQAPRQQAQQTWQDQLEQLSGQMAQQGILRSSNNLEGQGRLNTGYLNQVGQLDLSQQQQQEALDRQRNDYLQQLLQQGIQGQGAHAAFLADASQKRSLQQAQTAAAQEATQRQTAYNQQLQDAATSASSQFNNSLAPGRPSNQYSLGQQVNPATGEQVVSSAYSPLFGWLNLTNLGGTYTGGGGEMGIGGTDYGGSYLGYAGQTANPDQERAGNGDFSAGQISVDPTGAYTETNNAGSNYKFMVPTLDDAIKRRLGLT